MKDLHSKVARLRRKEKRIIIGLMSGTSVDGITAALTEITGTGRDTEIKLLGYQTYPYKEEMKTRIFNLFDPEKGKVQAVCEMNFAVGEAFAETVHTLLDDLNWRKEEVDLVGSHGQTIWHQPKATSISGYCANSTLQIGEPSIISEKTGLSVVADFRKADIAVGGEGAPLTPYLDYVLHRDPEMNRVLQNIGGIANLTYIPAAGGLEDLIAFDTGPGNMIIDAVMKNRKGESHDIDGKVAEKGAIDQILLAHLLSHPYYRRKPPKTTGRELFGEYYASEIMQSTRIQKLNVDDFVATVTALTVETIADAYQKYLPDQVDEVYVSGGGAKNPVLMRGLREHLSAPVYDYSRLGFPSEVKESVLTALLANEYIMGTPCNIPAATGARKQVTLGYLTWI